MDAFDYAMLSDFIGENWAMFLAFMEDRGIDEPACEEFADKLDQLGGRK